MVCSMVSKDLHSAIIYSYAFADENNDVYIVTDTAMVAEIIKSEKETVISFLKETDDIEKSRLAVLCWWEMIYKDGYEKDRNIRFLSCPRCGNEKYSEEVIYCHICCFSVYNK